jgi:hypothetical protein
MKRTILVTMLALSLSLGVNSVYAQQGVKWSNAASKQFASCSSCGSASAISTWQQIMFVLLMVYIP